MAGQTTYRIKIQTDGNDIVWPKVTEPTESGSPIVVVRDDGLHLLALAGNVYNKIEAPTEIAARPDVAGEILIPDQKDMVNEITSHPGSGKTFRTIPEIVRLHLGRLKHNQKIIVTGPTRVVCNELYRALVDRFGIDVVSTAVKGLPHRAQRSVKVLIIAHSTLAQLILAEDPIVSSMAYLVVDEDHVDDTGTYIVKEYARSMTEHGLTSWFLSATHSGDISTKSNYPINDQQIGVADVLNVVKKEYDKGKKIILFCGGIKGAFGTTECRRKLVNNHEIPFGTIVELNSTTYGRVASRLNDPECKIIISTNIAECGINIDADVVVDTRKNFYYLYNNGAVQGVTETITESSRVQRRGRIGRKRPGDYYYVANSDMDFRMDSASAFDAHLMIRNLPWYEGYDHYPNLPPITRKQALIALQKGHPPKP